MKDTAAIDAAAVRLSLMVAAAEQNAFIVAEQVWVVRHYGGTWATVGAALGVTRQAASQRYGRQSKHAVP
jgi:hypothetical protein